MDSFNQEVIVCPFPNLYRNILKRPTAQFGGWNDQVLCPNPRFQAASEKIGCD